MEVTVTGRHCKISEAVEEQVVERLTSTINKLQDRAIRAEVQFTASNDKGSPHDDMRCEITLRGRGPVVRAGATASDKMAAFDQAEEKLKSQLRKAADRRKSHRGLRARDFELPADFFADEVLAEPAQQTKTIAGIEVSGDGPLVVREKVFETIPLSLAQALDEMELVGHDFFLYVDAQTGQPSVVYRRKAYDYGVIHLNVAQPESES